MLTKFSYPIGTLLAISILNAIAIAPSQAEGYDCKCASYRACKVRQRALMAVPTETVAATPTTAPTVEPPPMSAPTSAQAPAPEPEYQPAPTTERQYQAPRGRG
jgi:hypothetical protein